MSGDNLSLVRFHVMNFFALMLNNRPFMPVSTTLTKVVEALILSEPDPDPEHLKKVRWFYNNTHECVGIPLPIVELAVFKNLHHGVNCDLSIYDKDFTLYELYKYLDELSVELSKVVIDVARKYSVDIPMMNFGSKGNDGMVNI